MKKRLIFLLVLIIILSVTLIGCSCENGDGEPSGETMGTIDVPGGGKIKVVSKLPAELKLTFKELGIDSFFCPILSGKIKNVSQYTVSYDKISFVLDGKEIDRAIGETLGPGEETAFYKGPIVGPSIMQAAKILEVKAVGFEKEGSASKPTEEPTEEPMSMPELKMALEEMVIEWYNLMRKGQFSEVIKLYTLSEQQMIESLGGIKAIEEAWQERPVTKMEIEDRTEIDLEDSEARVCAIFDYADGLTGDHVSFGLKKENGQWKLERVKKIY